MKVERILPLPLTKAQALACAVRAAEEQLNVRAEGAKYLGGGSFGRAVGLTLPGGRKIVVKLLRAKDMMEKEAHDLRLLRAHCPVKMPAVLFERRAGGDIPADCYGMEHIEGKSALFALGMLLWGEKKRLAFAEEVTAALHAVHACTSEKFGDTMHPDCDAWLHYYRPFAERVLEKAEDMYAAEKLSEKVIAAMRAAWSKFDVIFSEPVKEACLIHGDLNVANIMVGRGGKLTGFIDPLNQLHVRGQGIRPVPVQQPDGRVLFPLRRVHQKLRRERAVRAEARLLRAVERGVLLHQVGGAGGADHEPARQKHAPEAGGAVISLRARLLRLLLRAYTYPARRAHRSLSRSVRPKSGRYRPPAGFSLREERCGGVRVEVLSPPAREGAPLLHFHGGGHTQPMNDMYRRIAERYARLTGGDVYSIDYEAGADKVYPTVHDDCFAAYRALAAQTDLSRAAAAGDSFGANLLLHCCLRARSEGRALPRALVLVSPFADLSAS